MSAADAILAAAERAHSEALSRHWPLKQVAEALRAAVGVYGLTRADVDRLDAIACEYQARAAEAWRAACDTADALDAALAAETE